MLSKALIEGLSLRAALNVWWSMVVPVLNYGSELWGATTFEEAEKVQLEAGRRMLGVSRTLANAVVRGELGWWTMRAQRDLKMLMYWAKLVRLDHPFGQEREDKESQRLVLLSSENSGQFGS